MHRASVGVRARACVAGAIAAVLAGCAGRGLTPDQYFATPDGRRALGRVAYVVSDSPQGRPEARFATRNKLHGAVKGFGKGLGVCAAGLAEGGELGLILFIVISPACALVGTVGGTVSAPSGKTVRSAETAARQGMKDLRPVADLQAALSQHLTEQALDLPPLPARYIPAGPRPPAYPAEARAFADTVLEASTVRIGTQSHGTARELRFELVVRFRLVAVGPVEGRLNSVLDEFTFDYRGQPVFFPDPADAWSTAEDAATGYRDAVGAAAARWPRVLSRADQSR